MWAGYSPFASHTRVPSPPCFVSGGADPADRISRAPSLSGFQEETGGQEEREFGTSPVK